MGLAEVPFYFLRGYRRDIALQESAELLASNGYRQLGSISMPAATRMPPRSGPCVRPPTPQNKSTATIRRGCFREKFACDPDMTADELRAALDRAEYKRRELANTKSANMSEGSKLLTILPNAAELYRRQIALDLDGAHPQIMLKARLAIRELLGQIRLEPGENGSLWAAYEVHPGALVRNAVSGFAG
jgi:hypothetical protein